MMGRRTTQQQYRRGPCVSIRASGESTSSAPKVENGRPPADDDGKTDGGHNLEESMHANIIPEPFRSWLMHASEVNDDKERWQHIKEITDQLRATYPHLFRQENE